VPLQVGSPDERSIQLVGYPVMQPDGSSIGRTLVARRFRNAYREMANGGLGLSHSRDSPE